jgi:rfaE bifunctional protein nucleotidyltransferase chain/domain
MRKLKASKVMSPSQAARFIEKSRARNKIVFTNGCFDILHVGHVSYLERAKDRGDLLVVALDTDSSVSKLKGKNRPIHKLKDRMKVISSLSFVDLVTWFEDSDPLPLITKLKPDILVKGGDWKPSKIRGAKEVKSWGGKVFSLPFLKGHSTTSILKKIHRL